jgi:hypothetical protein
MRESGGVLGLDKKIIFIREFLFKSKTPPLLLIF